EEQLPDRSFLGIARSLALAWVARSSFPGTVDTYNQPTVQSQARTQADECPSQPVGRTFPYGYTAGGLGSKCFFSPPAFRSRFRKMILDLSLAAISLRFLNFLANAAFVSPPRGGIGKRFQSAPAFGTEFVAN